MNQSLKPGSVSRALIEIVWQFGAKGPDGECCEDLSMPEYLALEAAALNDDCAVQLIGNKIGFTKSGATRIVNRLGKKGMYARFDLTKMVDTAASYQPKKEKRLTGELQSSLTND